MRKRKFIATIIAIALLVPQFYWLSFIAPTEVYAVEQTNIAEKYFYNQLTEEAKVFYDALDSMLYNNDYSKIKGELGKQDTKFGVNSYDLTDKFDEGGNSLQQSLHSKLEAYTKGNQELLNLMATGRDAWMADHAGAFYVDSSNITLRVTRDNQQKLHVFIGVGRTDTYINKTFWDSAEKKVKKDELIKALDAVKSAKDEMVKEVKSVKAVAGQSLQEQQARKAHDLIIAANTYKLEETIIDENKNDGKNGDPYSVRNVYGAFVTHEIVCEGFGRAFKMIMDEVNIPCILVYGAFVSTNQYEEHLWNYVQLEDGKWYGIDLTWDNTDEIEDEGYAGKHEKIRAEYFLAGNDKMQMNHLVTGTMSAAKYEFKYPELEASSDRYAIASENAGLTVEIDTDNYDTEDEIDASKLKISYVVDLNENGVIDAGERMGYTEAKKHGYYFVSKFLAYNKADVEGHHPGSTVIGGSDESWGGSAFYAYVDPNIYGSVTDVTEDNGDSYISFYNANSQFMQFGVTDCAPWTYEDWVAAGSKKENIEKMTTYFGTSADLLAVSDMVFNPNGDYIAAPYIKRANPILNSTMYIGETYHCEVEYDDILIPVEGKQLSEVGYNVTIEYSSNEGSNDYKIENFKFDGKSTVTFDFTPSEKYADDSIFYNIELTNLMGQKSGKPPMLINWFCAHRCSAYAYKSQGFDWNVYGKPSLMDDVNLDELSESENEDLSELLKHRLTLVTTTTKPSEEKAMKDLLDKGKDKDGENLDVGGTIEKTETYNITLTLCKAQKISDGQKVRVMLGFPAGYGPEDAGVTFKAYHYIKDKTGRITGVEEIPCYITELGLIVECESFSPFTIATIKNSELGKVADQKTKTIIFQSSKGGDVYIDGKKADSIVLDESQKSEVELKIKPEAGYVVDNIVFGNQVVNLENKQISQDDSSEITYTLKYSDLTEEEFNSLVAKVAFIPKSTIEEEKKEHMTVVAQPLVAQPEFELATVTNKIVTVNQEERQSIEEKQLANSFNKDDIIEVSYSLTGMTDVKEKIDKIKATLTYDKDAFEYVEDSIKSGDKWNFTVNKSKDGELNISGESQAEEKSEQIGDVFSVRFKVLKDEDSQQAIALSNIIGGENKEENTPVCTDVVTNIMTAKKQVETENEIKPVDGSKCTIKDDIILGINPKSTISELSEELKSDGNKLITYYGTKLKENEDGNIVADAENLLQVSTKLTGDDVLCTGDSAKIGNKTYMIVMSGDVDGSGDLDMSDIALVLSSYRAEDANDKLKGIYKQAGNVDENVEVDMTDVANMLNYYRKLQSSPKPDAD